MPTQPVTVTARITDPDGLGPAFRAAYDEAPYADGLRDTGGKVTLAIHDCPKPVIAAINGPAVGIGATMTCAMDLRLASSKARIGFVFGLVQRHQSGGTGADHEVPFASHDPFHFLQGPREVNGRRPRPFKPSSDPDCRSD